MRGYAPFTSANNMLRKAWPLSGPININHLYQIQAHQPTTRLAYYVPVIRIHKETIETECCSIFTNSTLIKRQDN